MPRSLFHLAACLFLAALGYIGMHMWRASNTHTKNSTTAPRPHTRSAAPTTSPASPWKSLLDDSLPLETRLDLARSIDIKTTKDGSSILFDALSHIPTPDTEQDWWVVMNEIMDQMRKKGIGAELYTARLSALIQDPSHHEVARDYAIQHLAQWIAPVGGDITPGEENPENTRKALATIAAAAANPALAHSTVSGTALLALMDASTRLPAEATAATWEGLRPYLTEVICGQAAAVTHFRISALQAVALRGDASQLPAIQTLPQAAPRTPACASPPSLLSGSLLTPPTAPSSNPLPPDKPNSATPPKPHSTTTHEYACHALISHVPSHISSNAPMKPRLHSHLPALLTALSLSLLASNLDAANNDPPDSSLTIRGHHVVVNDDDENNNQLWDKTENPSVNSGLKGGTGRLPTQGEPILEAFQISATHVPGADCKLTIESSLGNKVKLWKDASKTQPFTLTGSYDITDPDSGNIQFYVEGIEPTDTFNQLYISATYKVSNQFGSDEAKSEIKFGVTRADIDVDSNNNGTIEDDAADDQLEFSSNEGDLGKILLETNGDVDNDGFVDCFDGLGLTSTGSTAAVAGLNLTPLKVKLLAPYNPDKAQVTFTYTANIPRLGAGITSTGTAESPAYTISQRGIRLWKVDGHARTNGNDITTTGGHFIPSGTPIPWKSIAPPAPSGGTIPRETTLYLEYVDLPTGKTYSKEDILFTVQDPQSTNSKKGYIKNHGSSTPTYLAEKSSPDAVCASLLPIEVDELWPLASDENGDEIAGSSRPSVGRPLTPFVELNPTVDRIAHRELRVLMDETFHGRRVTWTLDAIPDATPANIRGQWTHSATHSDRFEASAHYGASGFTRLSQESARTTVDNDGFTAIRINVPPIGFNQIRIRIQIEGVTSTIDLIDMEVPAVVVIDPGHGGTVNMDGSNWNNATSPSGVMEKAMALNYGTALRDSLREIRNTERLNLRVFMTREVDQNITGAARAAVARDNGADIISIIHFNASDHHTARGTLGVYRTTNNVFPQQDTILSEGIITRMVEAMREYDAAANHRERVANNTAVASDLNNGNTTEYCPVRTAYIEVDFIDYGAHTQTSDDDLVDILLNTGPNAQAVEEDVADAMQSGIIHDLRNHQPQP